MVDISPDTIDNQQDEEVSLVQIVQYVMEKD